MVSVQIVWGASKNDQWWEAAMTVLLDEQTKKVGIEWFFTYSGMLNFGHVHTNALGTTPWVPL